MRAEIVEVLPFGRFEIVEVWNPFYNIGQVRIDARPSVVAEGVAIRTLKETAVVDATPAVSADGGYRVVQGERLLVSQNLLIDLDTGDPFVMADGEEWVMALPGFTGLQIHTGRDIEVDAAPAISAEGAAVRRLKEKVKVAAGPSMAIRGSVVRHPTETISVKSRPAIKADGAAVRTLKETVEVVATPALVVVGAHVHIGERIRIQQLLLHDPLTGDAFIMADGEYLLMAPAGLESTQVHTGRDIEVDAHPAISVGDGIHIHQCETMSIAAAPDVQVDGIVVSP